MPYTSCAAPGQEVRLSSPRSAALDQIGSLPRHGLARAGWAHNNSHARRSIMRAGRCCWRRDRVPDGLRARRTRRGLHRAVATILPCATVVVEDWRAEAELTPKPGLVDGRGPGAHADMTVRTLHDSAEALRTAFVQCASAAMELEMGTDLRAEIGVIGRVGEQNMLAATGGVNTHRGALWALGLLCAGVARGRGVEEAVAFAARLASVPDPALVAFTPARRSHGALVRRRFGVSGAAGEAQAGFPHVTAYALPMLQAARLDGADEEAARLDALLSLIAHLDDTCVLHRGGRGALRAVQAGAADVLRAGGYRTAHGQRHFRSLDVLCARRRLSPGGSGDLLSATLFLDAIDDFPRRFARPDERTAATCKP